MQQFISNLRDENGQTMAEYASSSVSSPSPSSRPSACSPPRSRTRSQRHRLAVARRRIAAGPARGRPASAWSTEPRVVSSPAHERRQSGDVDHLGRDRHRDGRRARVDGLSGVPGEWVGVIIAAILASAAFALGYAE